LNGGSAKINSRASMPEWIDTGRRFGGASAILLQEDVVMRTYDFAPLFRSTVGFDRLFDMIDSTVRPDWPPYNIEKTGESQYRISMAIAGFGPDEIELTQQGNVLLITGQKKTDEKHHEMLHQGLASRNFKQTFNLADHVKVTAAELENGMLVVDLLREVPEQLKPRRIALGSRAATPPGQGGIAQDNVGQDKPQRLVQGIVSDRRAA
jgi:molecular chaperone IbpA